MRSSKLTLSIPQKLLVEAKIYSRKTKQPLSRLVSRYFSLLGRLYSKEKLDPQEITPKVRRVTGIAKSGRREDDLLLESLLHKYS